MAAVLLLLTMPMIRTGISYFQLRHRLDEARRTNQELMAVQEDLQKQIEDLEDPSVIERLAREELGLSLIHISHRDYAFSASTLISIFTDRIEFVSIGGLPKGITYEDILLGVSVPRNPRLANIFYRLRLIEAFGTGIPKIKGSYQGQAAQDVYKRQPLTA